MTELQVLRREITIMREAAEIRNRELDALHMVWCSGGCKNGVHRYVEDKPSPEDLEEFIRIGERNLERLKGRLRTARWRESLGYAQNPPR